MKKDPTDFETHSSTWRYLVQHLQEERAELVNNMVATDDRDLSARYKGQIQYIDELLNLPSRVLTERLGE